ncbi:MAG: GntR family transcriptional regulator [Candidatus Krumholzibacteriia bacterium]
MFERQPLRQAVQREILARLSDGRLPAGIRINETHLSADLGISRTPLREAMLHLEAGGFLLSDMGKGFVVPALTRREFAGLQEVLARLAPLALSSVMPLPGQRIMELNNLLNRSKMHVLRPGPDQATALMELVFRWGLLLVESCPNAILRQDVQRLEALSRRYWFTALRAGFLPEALMASFDEMYDLVRTGQSARAASHWSDHILRFAQEAGRMLPDPAPRPSSS